jgi:ABC-2 type transport system ATP-binding protein/lipopolysaccharide transport system ATP-binding protein
MAIVVQAEGLGKRYRLGEGGYVTLREQVANRLRPRSASHRGAPEVWALRDVTLAVDEGDAVGIVGRNGAGKTTFLKTVAGIVRPTTGVVRVRGRVGALLEVGTGFHPELTGRENVYLNGVVLGMSRRDVRSRFDEIVGFAGVERFLDTPLKRYSSGMYLRLAFAVAAHVDPDVLIVDEVLAVGDAEFQRRCLGRMAELGREGRTVLFVSHDTGTVGQLCRRAVWLDEGRVRAVGDARDVLEQYLRTAVPTATAVEARVDPDGPLEDLALRVLGADGYTVEAPRRDEPLTFEIVFTARQRIMALDAAVYLIDALGFRVVNENLSDVGQSISGPPQRYTVRFVLPPLLASGDYVAGVWLGDYNGNVFSNDLLRLTVLPLPDDREESAHGVVRPDVRWTIDVGSAA